jgi:hypothetical protein
LRFHQQLIAAHQATCCVKKRQFAVAAALVEAAQQLQRCLGSPLIRAAAFALMKPQPG